MTSGRLTKMVMSARPLVTGGYLSSRGGFPCVDGPVA